MSQAKPLLILFTRYPEAGRTKTRMIPRLGPQGAADLQRDLTRHLLAKLGSEQDGFDLQVRFAGGDVDAMREMFGSFDYVPQEQGDLGQKLEAAFTAAFDAGRSAVAIIGADCPFIETGDVSRAFEELEEHDVVLGPAADGGYYLIAAKTTPTALLTGIDWGTEVVREQTLEAASRHGLKVGQLRMLSDIDEPADYQLWSGGQQSPT